MSAGHPSDDDRLPVWLDGAPRPGAAYLVEGDGAAPPGASSERFEAGDAHPAGCACCAGRSQAASALGRLFIDRARASRPPFTCVVVRASAAGRAAVLRAVAADALARARYRAGRTRS